MIMVGLGVLDVVMIGNNDNDDGDYDDAGDDDYDD